MIVVFVIPTLFFKKNKKEIFTLYTKNSERNCFLRSQPLDTFRIIYYGKDFKNILLEYSHKPVLRICGKISR